MIIATRPAYQPLPSHSVSGSGARGTSDPPNRQCYPPHFMRECIPPNLHDPQRAKGLLDRRSKRLSFPHFFLRRKKCGRRRPPPRQGKTDSPPGRRNPPRAKEVLKRSFKWFSLVTFFLQKKKVTRAEARNAPSRARRRNTCSPPGQRPPRERFLCLRRPHFFQQRKKWEKERRQKLRFCTSSARYTRL